MVRTISTNFLNTSRTDYSDCLNQSLYILQHTYTDKMYLTHCRETTLPQLTANCNTYRLTIMTPLRME